MAKPRLASKTPDTPETNALIDFHEELLASPNTPRIALVEFIVPESKRKNATGEETATVQIVHLELLHGADAEAGEKLFTAVHKARTGNKTRPFPETTSKPAADDVPLDGIDDSVD